MKKFSYNGKPLLKTVSFCRLPGRLLTYIIENAGGLLYCSWKDYPRVQLSGLAYFAQPPFSVICLSLNNYSQV